MTDSTPTPYPRRRDLRQTRPERTTRRRTPAVRRSRRPSPRPALLATARLALAAILAATAMPAAMVGQQAVAEPTTTRPQESQQVVIDSAAAPQRSAPEQYTATTGEELRAAANMRTAATFLNDSASSVQWPFPVGVPLTDRFGPRRAPCGGCSTDHKGLDMTPGVGSPISVIADGVVLETDESDSGFGVYAKVEHLVNGRKYVSLYAHMQFSSLQVAPGQVVRVGDRIGSVGNTGQSTGPHLHLEIWRDGTTPIDPYAWLTDLVGS